LNLGFYIFNSVRGFYIKSNGLSSQSFDEDLHAAT
jgi:hypothetical protein